jgi:hypothetical protein
VIYKYNNDASWQLAWHEDTYDPFMGMKVGDAVGWWIESAPSAVKEARECCYRYNKNSPYQFTTEKRYVHINYGGLVTLQPKGSKDTGREFLIITKVK